MAAAVNAGRGARVYCKPSGINKVAYPIDSTRRPFSAHSSPERACAATTPNRNGRPALMISLLHHPPPVGEGIVNHPPPVGEGRVGACRSGNRWVLRLGC